MVLSASGLKKTIKSVYRQVFEKGQYLGFDILPRHFYSEVPDIRELRKTGHWKKPFSMIGVKGSEIDSQLQFVRECCAALTADELMAKQIHQAAVTTNGEDGFGTVEADFLYAFMVAQKPQQIFQIGCGVSTAVCLMAANEAGYNPQIVCVEPYPTSFLREAAAEGRIQLIEQKVELLELQIIENLQSDLLFFVDSTHTLGPAGEVSRIVLEMLPRLKPGAWVHFHDIYFPYDYDRHLLSSALFFQHESTLLHAFLACNERFNVKASLSMLHYAAPEALSVFLERYHPAASNEGLAAGDGHFPSSIYLKVVG